MNIFYITYFIWLLSELLLNRLLHSRNTDKQDADKNSLSAIWITIIASVTAATLLRQYTSFPIALGKTVPYLGLDVIFLGIIIRFLAIRSLGRFFTVDVTIREGHQLKKDGLYKYLRHPSYFASLVSFIGFGISLNNWLSLMLVTIAITTVFLIRIRVEEEALIAEFGDEYRNYQKTTWGLIPFIY